MRYDTVRALGISISMEKGGNIVTLGEKVDARLEQLKSSRIPVGIDFQKVFLDGLAIKHIGCHIKTLNVQEVKQNGIFGNYLNMRLMELLIFRKFLLVLHHGVE